jgi:hypothetical protein
MLLVRRKESESKNVLMVEDDCAHAETATSRSMQSGLDLYFRCAAYNLVRMRSWSLQFRRGEFWPKCVQ